MIVSRFGHFLDRPLSPIVRTIPLDPHIFTAVGFLITVIAALVIPHNLRIGGILILIGGVFDILDGVVARVNKKETKFGEFLDSVVDRYSDAFLFLALTWYFVERGNYIGVFLSLGTLVGAFVVSYARARAEGLGQVCSVGIMERPERIILLAFAAITGWLTPVLCIMFFLTHFTVAQRIYHVWKVMREG